MLRARRTPLLHLLALLLKERRVLIFISGLVAQSEPTQLLDEIYGESADLLDELYKDEGLTSLDKAGENASTILYTELASIFG